MMATAINADGILITQDDLRINADRNSIMGFGQTGNDSAQTIKDHAFPIYDAVAAINDHAKKGNGSPPGCNDCA